MTQKVKEKVTFATRGAIDEGCMAKYSNRKQLLCYEIWMKISVGGKELEKTKLFERVFCCNDQFDPDLRRLSLSSE